jgi:hypothetical protein
MACQTPQDLDLYLVVKKKEMKSINAKYQIQVRYWIAMNHLQDYKICPTMIYMFDKDFFNSLLKLLVDNPWSAHSTNQNYKTQLLRQSNHLLGFVSPNKYSLYITIIKKWPENQSNLEEGFPLTTIVLEVYLVPDHLVQIVCMCPL